jgi:GNAT superfamily N-acetyltransferase
MFDFQYDVNIPKLLVDCDELLKKHWEELALNKDKVPLAIDEARYKQLQDVGILKNIVVYNNQNVAVGYSVLLIQPHLHYSTTVYAAVDVIYIDPEYRNTTLGARLLVAAEKQAKEHGASIVLHHAKPYVPMIIKPLEKLGYSLYEHMYGKYVGE